MLRYSKKTGLTDLVKPVLKYIFGLTESGSGAIFLVSGVCFEQTGKELKKYDCSRGRHRLTE